MLSLEEYIEKRKTEDGINEFDVSQKINNIRTCINYIFEYFDQYLSIQGAERHTITENEKIRKYENFGDLCRSRRIYGIEIPRFDRGGRSAGGLSSHRNRKGEICFLPYGSD